MKYRVLVAPAAEAAIADFIAYIAVERHEPENAQRVLASIRHSVSQLEHFPHAAPLAPENEHKDYLIRARVVASCLLLYNVDDARRIVRVIGFRHGSRLPRPEELPDDPSKPVQD